MVHIFKAGYVAQRPPAQTDTYKPVRVESGSLSLPKTVKSMAERDAVLKKLFFKGAKLKAIAAAVGYADERGVRVRLQRLGLFPKLPKRVAKK